MVEIELINLNLNKRGSNKMKTTKREVTEEQAVKKALELNNTKKITCRVNRIVSCLLEEQSLDATVYKTTDYGFAGRTHHDKKYNKARRVANIGSDGRGYGYYFLLVY